MFVSVNILEFAYSVITVAGKDKKHTKKIGHEGQ